MFRFYRNLTLKRVGHVGVHGGRRSCQRIEQKTTLPLGAAFSERPPEEKNLLYRRWLVVASMLVALPHAWQAPAFGQQSPAPDNSKAPQSATQPDEINILVTPSSSAPAAPEIKIPNFASCSLAELQHAIPELAHLKFAEDQSQLASLLDQIGATTVDIARKTPNLISNEAVVLEQGGATTRLNFSFLVVQRQMDPKSVVFDEYRVDLKSGEKIETEFEKVVRANSDLSSEAIGLPSPGGKVMPQGTQGPPSVSKGFVNQWLYFHPLNRRDSDFRYLGEQIVDGHRTLAIAFAQKPGSVRLPATIAYQDKNLAIFMQGVAWIDPTNFRIIRLRSDLLAPPSGVPLRQLTTDIQFAEIRVADAPSPLWVPQAVTITASMGAVTVHESHSYSGFRLFRARSKILLNP